MAENKRLLEGGEIHKVLMLAEDEIIKSPLDMFSACYSAVAEAQDAKTARIVAEEIFKEVEETSMPMNTNMYGVSLSREDWYAIKKKYLEVKD